MSHRGLAYDLFGRALIDGHAACRMDRGDDATTVRAEVRRLAKGRGVVVRTGMWGDVVVVIMADAGIWGDTTAVMRAKLTPARDGRRIR